MFRQSLLPRACLTLALGLTLSHPSAWGQERSPYERLDRIERDLNMLQRHVYRGATVSAYPADGPASVNTQLRIDRLEAEMRNLTGRVEEYGNRLEQLIRRVEQASGDAGPRFGQGSGPAAQGAVGAAMPPARSGTAVGPPPPARPPAMPERLGSHGDERGPLSAGPPTAGPAPTGSTSIGGTLTPPGVSPAAPPRSTDPASAAVRPVASDGVLPGGSATEQYNYAFGLMKEAKYPAAEAAFKEFVETHPKDQMAGNAQYWLGETYFARGMYMEAASSFADGYKRYPKNTKAPDALLKLGMSLARAEQKQNACVAFAKLGDEFPHAAASVRQRAASEMKKLGC